jgi:hypothetical protein
MTGSLVLGVNAVLMNALTLSAGLGSPCFDKNRHRGRSAVAG